MVLIILYVVLTFESVDEILWCYHSNETSSAVLSHGTIYLVCSSFKSAYKNLWSPFKNISSAVLSHIIICSSVFSHKKKDSFPHGGICFSEFYERKFDFLFNIVQ